MGFRVRGFRASRNLEDLELREGGCERERETEREKILHP